MIKIALLKKRLMKNGAIALAMLLVAGGVMAWGISMTAGLTQEFTNLDSQSRREISDAQKEQEEYERTLVALKQYESIPEHRLPANDYDNVQSRIRVIRPIVERLKEQYKFSVLDVQIANFGGKAQDKAAPKNNNDTQNDNELYDIIRSDLNITFEGITDEFVYAFLQALIEEIPGYVTINAIDITRKETITPELLEHVAASHQAVPLVSGTIKLAWNTLKPKAQAEQESGTETE